METSIKESKFGDIILWDKTNKKFIVVRNYYKLPNLLKTNDYETCCMSLGNGSFISLKQSNNVYYWYEAMKKVKDYRGLAPIKSYLPSIDELIDFYPLIKEFNNKIEKLQSLGIECQTIKMWCYWSSTVYMSGFAFSLNTKDYSGVRYNRMEYYRYVRAFVAF